MPIFVEIGQLFNFRTLAAILNMVAILDFSENGPILSGTLILTYKPILVHIHIVCDFLWLILYFFQIQNGRQSKMAAIFKISKSETTFPSGDLSFW